MLTLVCSHSLHLDPNHHLKPNHHLEFNHHLEPNHQACREAGKFVVTPVSGPYSPHKKGNNRYTQSHGGKAVVDEWTEHVRSQPDMVRVSE
jgi:hypothetical protein